MISSARHRAAVAILVAAALCAAGGSTTDRAATSEAPRATVPSPPQPAGNNGVPRFGVDVGSAASWPASASDTTASDTTASDTTASDTTELRPVVSPPRRVVMPTIDVDAQIIDLGLTPDGALETPTDFDMAGWWAGGTVADEEGPTVIVGHVDDQNGPAVFFRLQELEPGDSIIVIDDLGREQSFTVVDKGLYDKDSFPTERVYGTSEEPTLRLVTCGGEFDRSERSYESNWVVYAVSV